MWSLELSQQIGTKVDHPLNFGHLFFVQVLLAHGWIVDQDSSVEIDSGIFSPVTSHLLSQHVNDISNMARKSEKRKG